MMTQCYLTVAAVQLTVIVKLQAAVAVSTVVSQKDTCLEAKEAPPAAG
jgi:hypothetical protein